MQAVRSYERAGHTRERDVAYAYHLREYAKAQPVTARTTDTSRVDAYIAAAEAFLSSAEVADSRQEKLAYYRIAAECFVEGGDYGRAGKAYLSASDFTRSAQYYRKAGMFDEAVEVIQVHKRDIPSKTAKKIMDVAKIHYFTANKIE